MRVHVCTRGWRSRKPTVSRLAQKDIPRAAVLRAVTESWSTTPEVACRINRHESVIGLDGALYALERAGLVESRKSHSSRHRHWRLTPRGAEGRDLTAHTGQNQE